MSARIHAKLVIALLLIAVVFTSVTTILNAQEQAPSKDRLIVHEWGTFTSVTTADGKAQSWSPLAGPSDLPNFVYRSKEAQPSAQGRCLKCELALVRMETPVLYFYADRATKVSVNVDFPQGRITEWYPQARTSNRGIHWPDFIVLPGAQAVFPVERGESHYYPARATDAAPLRLTNGQQTEHEKFLFYRGVGNFALPLTIKLAGEQVTVSNAGQEELAQIILFENCGGRVGW